MTLPNFLVIGIAKGGTTTLFHWMRQHPEVSLPYQKEIHFFDNDSTWECGSDYYEAQFKDCKKTIAIGDISPGYFERAETVIPRVLSFFSDNPPKIVLLLRDPVDRAYSYWHFRVCYYREERSFEDVFSDFSGRARLDLRPKGFDYFTDGFYATKLCEWQKTFGKENVKVLLTEDLASRPDESLTSLFAFLGVDTGVKIDTGHLKNVASQPRIRFIMNLLSDPPMMIRKVGRVLLSGALKRDLKQTLYELNAKPVRKTPLERSVEQKLREFYRGDVIRTADLIGRNLDHWIK